MRRGGQIVREWAEPICPEGGGVRQQGKTVENGNQEGLHASNEQMLLTLITNKCSARPENVSAVCLPDRELSFERKFMWKEDTG